ncbi:MAG: phospho-N-acetylmuramoyl-pentapeptide-transferase [Planctomycetota bacterium]|nr:phospho-N-acetylmuramoyl-pentapeptide-transferase [Planctomycetota bacterium]
MFYNLLQSGHDWLESFGGYSLLQVLYQIEFRAFFAVILSFAIVLLMGERTIRWLLRQKLGDSPEFYNADLNQLMATKANVPTMGGILIAAAILVTVLLLADLFNSYIHLCLIVLVWLAVLGGFDDWLKLTTARRRPGAREGLFAWEKLLFQLGIGVICGMYLWRLTGDSESARALTLPFQRTYVPGTEGLVLEPSVIVLGWLPFVLITMLWIAGTSNAVNITDGMDGLASGLVLIASLALMLLAYIAGSSGRAQHMLFPFVEGSEELMVVAGAMAGASLGFLWFNCAPARVFMGDTGSLPLGGLLATLACAVRQEVLLIVIGAVFFWELLSVMLQVGWFRITGGRRIFRCSPIHHHFHLGGWSESQVVVRFWILGVVAVVAAAVLLKLR